MFPHDFFENFDGNESGQILNFVSPKLLQVTAHHSVNVKGLMAKRATSTAYRDPEFQSLGCRLCIVKRVIAKAL